MKTVRPNGRGRPMARRKIHHTRPNDEGDQARNRAAGDRRLTTRLSSSTSPQAKTKPARLEHDGDDDRAARAAPPRGDRFGASSPVRVRGARGDRGLRHGGGCRRQVAAEAHAPRDGVGTRGIARAGYAEPSRRPVERGELRRDAVADRRGDPVVGAEARDHAVARVPLQPPARRGGRTASTCPGRAGARRSARRSPPRFAPDLRALRPPDGDALLREAAGERERGGLAEDLGAPAGQHHRGRGRVEAQLAPRLGAEVGDRSTRACSPSSAASAAPVACPAR